MKPSKRIINIIRRIQIAQMKLYEEGNQTISMKLASYNREYGRDWAVYIHNTDNDAVEIWHIYEDTTLEEIENIFNEMYDLIGFVF